MTATPTPPAPLVQRVADLRELMAGVDSLSWINDGEGEVTAGDGEWVSCYGPRDAANAALIVAAVNALPDLLAALDAMARERDSAVAFREYVPMLCGTFDDASTLAKMDALWGRMGDAGREATRPVVDRINAATRAEAEAARLREALRNLADRCDAIAWDLNTQALDRVITDANAAAALTPPGAKENEK